MSVLTQHTVYSNIVTSYFKAHGAAAFNEALIKDINVLNISETVVRSWRRCKQKEPYWKEKVFNYNPRTNMCKHTGLRERPPPETEHHCKHNKPC